MKTYLFTTIVLLFILTLPGLIYAQGTDPAAVVTASVEAFQEGDLEESLAYFADEAVYQIVMPGAPPETYTGREEIQAWWDELLAQNFELEVKVLRVEGDTVTTETKTWVDFTRELGIAPLVATEVYIVQDGKIKSATWTPTEESAAKLQAAMALLPQTGGETSSSYILVISLGGVALLGGLGIALLQGWLSQRNLT